MIFTFKEGLKKIKERNFKNDFLDAGCIITPLALLLVDSSTLWWKSSRCVTLIPQPAV